MTDNIFYIFYIFYSIFYSIYYTKIYFLETRYRHIMTIDDRDIFHPTEKCGDKLKTREKIIRVGENIARMLYNVTIAEISPISPTGKLKMPGIPILDSLTRKLYWSSCRKEGYQDTFIPENGYLKVDWNFLRD